MAIQKKILRGVRDLRTLSGRVDAGSIPYMGYMKIASLEMERARREKEKDSAMHLIRSIDARFQDIEAEKHRLLSALALGERGDGGSAGPVRTSSSGAGRGPTTSSKRMDCAKTGGVRIKY
jgi:hypothetical protein